MAVTKSTTMIEYRDDFEFEWTIQGSLEEIKTLTGQGKITSENFNDGSQNVWQLRIEEVKTPNPSRKYLDKIQYLVYINLKLIESVYPTRSKMKYRCDTHLSYIGGEETPVITESSSIVNLTGIQLTYMDIQLFSLRDLTFLNLSNIYIKCRIQSEPQMVNVNCFGKNVWGIQKNHKGSNFSNANTNNKGGMFFSKFLNDHPEDIEVICKDVNFKIHKYLLTVQSEVFAKMFEVNLSEKQKSQIVIEDFEPKIVEIFLDYLKNVSNSAEVEKEIEEMGWEKTRDLFMSHKYQIDDLKTECVGLLCQKIDLQNAFEMLKFGRLYELADLQDTAMKFILTKKRSLDSMKIIDQLAEENPALMAEIQSEFWKNY